MTLHLPVMCPTCGSLVGKLLTRHLQKSLVYPLKLESSHSLTLIPYNGKPAYIQGKMIKEITIKFNTEIKPTQNSCKSQFYINDYHIETIYTSTSSIPYFRLEKDKKKVPYPNYLTHE